MRLSHCRIGNLNPTNIIIHIINRHRSLSWDLLFIQWKGCRGISESVITSHTIYPVIWRYKSMTVTQASDELRPCLVGKACEFFKKEKVVTSIKIQANKAWFDIECSESREQYQVWCEVLLNRQSYPRRGRNIKTWWGRKHNFGRINKDEKICQLARTAPLSSGSFSKLDMDI